MIVRVTAFVVLIVLFSTALPRANSECIVVTDWDAANVLRDSDLVFSGKLLKNERQDRLMFRAERIWKGPTNAAAIVIYVRERGYIGAYAFQVGETYLIFATELSDWDRTGLAVPREEKRAFGIHRACGSAPWPLKLTADLDKIARARKPTD
jgi:hypothetical protein